MVAACVPTGGLLEAYNDHVNLLDKRCASFCLCIFGVPIVLALDYYHVCERRFILVFSDKPDQFLDM